MRPYARGLLLYARGSANVVAQVYESATLSRSRALDLALKMAAADELHAALCWALHQLEDMPDSKLAESAYRLGLAKAHRALDESEGLSEPVPLRPDAPVNGRTPTTDGLPAARNSEEQS